MKRKLTSEASGTPYRNTALPCTWSISCQASHLRKCCSNSSSPGILYGRWLPASTPLKQIARCFCQQADEPPVERWCTRDAETLVRTRESWPPDSPSDLLLSASGLAWQIILRSLTFERLCLRFCGSKRKIFIWLQVLLVSKNNSLESAPGTRKFPSQSRTSNDIWKPSARWCHFSWPSLFQPLFPAPSWQSWTVPSTIHSFADSTPRELDEYLAEWWICGILRAWPAANGAQFAGHLAECSIQPRSLARSCWLWLRPCDYWRKLPSELASDQRCLSPTDWRPPSLGACKDQSCWIKQQSGELCSRARASRCLHRRPKMWEMRLELL